MAAIIERKVYVAVGSPIKAIWQQWATLPHATPKGEQRALREIRKKHPEFEFRVRQVS